MLSDINACYRVYYLASSHNTMADKFGFKFFLILSYLLCFLNGLCFFIFQKVLYLNQHFFIYTLILFVAAMEMAIVIYLNKKTTKFS